MLLAVDEGVFVRQEDSGTSLAALGSVAVVADAVVTVIMGGQCLIPVNESRCVSLLGLPWRGLVC